MIQTSAYWRRARAAAGGGTRRLTIGLVLSGLAGLTRLALPTRTTRWGGCGRGPATGAAVMARSRKSICGTALTATTRAARGWWGSDRASPPPWPVMSILGWCGQWSEIAGPVWSEGGWVEPRKYGGRRYYREES